MEKEDVGLEKTWRKQLRRAWSVVERRGEVEVQSGT